MTKRAPTQIYNARLEDGAWNITQASDWNWRWDFSGGGSMTFGVQLGGVTVEANGTLTQSYRNIKEGNGTWILDPATLKVIGKKPPGAKLPAEFGQLESDFPAWKCDAPTQTVASAPTACAMF